MATVDDADGDTDAPAAEGTHLFGDVYYIDRWPSWYWYLGAALCVLLPPAGVFLVVYLFVSNVTTGEERTVYADD